MGARGGRDLRGPPGDDRRDRAVLRHPHASRASPACVELAQPAGIAVGGQDLHWEDAGPFTGEVSGAELAELGATLVEVGHAERRAMFGETDEIVARKTLAGLRNGLAPVCASASPSRGAPAEAGELCIRQLESALAPARAVGDGRPRCWWPTSRSGPSAPRAGPAGVRHRGLPGTA